MIKAGRGLSSFLVGAVMAASGAGLAIANANAQKAGTGDRELGEYLSNQCTTCHQISGKSTGAIPPIIGWPEDQFVAVIQSYKEGVRDNETMRTISHRFSNEEIEALASYFGAIEAKQ